MNTFREVIFQWIPVTDIKQLKTSKTGEYWARWNLKNNLTMQGRKANWKEQSKWSTDIGTNEVESSEEAPLNVEPQQSKTDVIIQQEKKKWNKANKSWIPDDCSWGTNSISYQIMKSVEQNCEEYVKNKQEFMFIVIVACKLHNFHSCCAHWTVQHLSNVFLCAGELGKHDKLPRKTHSREELSQFFSLSHISPSITSFMLCSDPPSVQLPKNSISDQQILFIPYIRKFGVILFFCTVIWY